MSLKSQLRQLAQQEGLLALGFTTAEPFTEAQAVIEQRKAAGEADTMAFTFTNPQRSCDPSRLLTNARSVIVAALAYRAPKPNLSPQSKALLQRAKKAATATNNAVESTRQDAIHISTASNNSAQSSQESHSNASQSQGQGQSQSQSQSQGRAPSSLELSREQNVEATVGAYALQDHYALLRKSLENIGGELKKLGFSVAISCDDNALVDRAAALRAGIGWAGKNSNVLIPNHGSWLVLGSIVTDAALQPDQAIEADCGECTNCVQACPTGAITEDGVVDARKCLAWLLQKPGAFPKQLRESVGTRIYGCDSCQTSCPVGRSELERVEPDETTPELWQWLEMSDEELASNVEHWYVPKRDINVIRRNILIAIANSYSSHGTLNQRCASCSPTKAAHNPSSEANGEAHATRRSTSSFTSSSAAFSSVNSGAHMEVAKCACSAVAISASKQRLLEQTAQRSEMLAEQVEWTRAKLKAYTGESL